MTSWLLARCGRLRRALRQLGNDRRGVTMLEYGLIAALIAAVCVAAVTTLGSNLETMFINVAGSI